ncbi:MAG: zinc ribbon domain-containing protein [Actinomycetota bacterium]|nr:zinc ribbon domain-containing protein [Actinomycetota bacterium]
MPAYEYLCNKCEHAFEMFQSFSEAAIEVCPKCSGEVRKVYNNVGVVFKGSGFYKTDSRPIPVTKSDKPADKTESKPEKKAEKKVEPKAKD